MMMNNEMKNVEQYVKKLKGFYKIDWIKDSIELQKKPNFWTVIEYGKVTQGMQRSAHETRISKMLRWLLDPNETHQVGNVFAEKLLKEIGVAYKYSENQNKHVTVVNEYQHIDVLYKDFEQKLSLAIEVKQHAEEGISKDGESQLDRYEKIMRQIEDSKGLKAHCIYLTPLKTRPTNDKWIAVGYEPLIQIMEEMLVHYIEPSSSLYRDDTDKLVRDFKDELKRTVRIANKKNKMLIDAQLTPEEKKRTSLLAIELEYGKETPQFDEISQIVNDEDFPLKELILLTKECIASQIQDRTPNDAVRVLIRRIYNELSENQHLDLDLNITYSDQERLSLLSTDIRKHYNLNVETVQLTSGKGQGIHIKPKDERYRLYLSGDAQGNFPNDYIHLVKGKDGVRVNAKSIANRQFKVTQDSIEKGYVLDKEGNEISIEQLIENYILPSLQQLDEQAKAWEEEEQE